MPRPDLARRALLALLPAGCAGRTAAPEVPEVPLPPATGMGDEGHQAVMLAAGDFADTRRLANRPQAAALAAARLEWMAASLPYRATWTETSALLPGALAEARAETRAALAIPAAAPPAAVAREMLAAAAALEAGNAASAAAALDALSPGQGREILQRLQRLPPLPRTSFATSLARQELNRVMSDD
jgi:hypothetical protein